MIVDRGDWPIASMQEINTKEQDYDGPWFVEVRYHVVFTDCSYETAQRQATNYIEGSPLAHDESRARIRPLQMKKHVLPYGIEPFDVDDVIKSDKERE